jgi:hypothetical protein
MANGSGHWNTRRFFCALHRIAMAFIFLPAGVAVIAALTATESKLVGIVMSLTAVAGFLFFIEALLIVGRIWMISFRNWRRGRHDVGRRAATTGHLLITSAITMLFSAIPLVIALTCGWHAVRLLHKGR